jgi:hypothetical protein
MLRNGGFTLGLTAFFDETGTHEGHLLTGVAGFLYDSDGIARFEAEWRKRTAADFPEPFHTVDCFWGHGQFAGWPWPLRMQLMHELGDLISRTRIAGFVAYVEQEDYKKWAEHDPTQVDFVGSPYTICLLTCIEMVAAFLKSRKLDGEVFYLFEQGCSRQWEADGFLHRIMQNDLWRKGLRYQGHGFAMKKSASVLCTADFLGWQWQRNYAEIIESENAGNGPGYWRSEFQELTKDGGTSLMFRRQITDSNINMRLLTNAFYGFHRN